MFCIWQPIILMDTYSFSANLMAPLIIIGDVVFQRIAIALFQHGPYSVAFVLAWFGLIASTAALYPFFRRRQRGIFSKNDGAVIRMPF